MLIEINVLKNYPSANLNRDELGSPKSCYFGGIERGRISSQCLKRCIRQSDLMTEVFGKLGKGIRTRKLPELVADELRKKGITDEKLLTQLKEKALSIFNKKETASENKTKTSQIAFYSQADIEKLADLLFEECGDGKKVDWKELKEKIEKAEVSLRPISLDIAMFGRMTTSNYFRNVEASMQVAHAFSTNKAISESDFFTAVDDLVNAEVLEDQGAAIMQYTDYNSCCYYMYYNLDTDQLKKNLGEIELTDEMLKEVVAALIKAIVFANPSAKQNAFAGHALPDLVEVNVSDTKIPVSYANAFVAPAKQDNNKDLVQRSIEKLQEEIDSLDVTYYLKRKAELWLCTPKYKDVAVPQNCTKVSSLDELIAEVNKTVGA